MGNRAPSPRPATIIAVAIGGAVGATARVFLPWPTMLDDSLTGFDPLPLAIINLLGAALLGLVTGYSSQRRWPEPVIKGVTIGVFGAFTTMSAVALAFT
ncbi:MAG: CrcB family protein, partial [Yaniella sp.]|nr:CrcB family protein [Yaniella sp.]